MTHKYSDNCTCQNCTDAWDKELMKALERGEQAKKKKKKKKKS